MVQLGSRGFLLFSPLTLSNISVYISPFMLSIICVYKHITATP